MSDKEKIVVLTDEEFRLCEQYSRLPVGVVGRLNLWAVEVIPPAAFIGIAIYTGSISYYIAAIIVLAFFNVVRLARQHRSAPVLRSIANKLTSPREGENEKST